MSEAVKKAIITIISLIGDAALVILTFMLGRKIEYFSELSLDYGRHVILVSAAVTVFFFWMFGLYASKEESRYKTVSSAVFAMLAAGVILAAASVIFTRGDGFLVFMAFVTAALMAILSVWRLFISFTMVRFKSKKKILILESDKVPSRLARKLKYSGNGLEESWYYIINENDTESVCYLMERIVPGYDTVYISDNLSDEMQSRVFKLCIMNNITTYRLASPENVSLMGSSIQQFSDTPIMVIPPMRLTRAQRIIKRLFDLVFASAALICTSPFMLIIAILIKLDSPGPVFYRQERYTIGKKRFMVCKFRTMRTDAEKHGAQFAAENDPRVTRVGRIIRKLRMDELPQFLNILAGHMSVVGPRPERPIFADEFSEKVKNYDMRYLIKAGLTGYAQVYGKYCTRVSDKILMDMIYAIKYSFWLDIKLILLTIRTMFKRESTEGVEEALDKELGSPEREAVRRRNEVFFKTEERRAHKDENIRSNACV